MKKIYKILLALTFSPALLYSGHAAYSPAYLNDAANAWTQTLDPLGNSNTIATYMRDTQTTNPIAFSATLDAIAFNDTTLNLYTTINHVNGALGFLHTPEKFRRAGGKSLSIQANGRADTDKYTSDNNSDFEMRTFGFGINASAWITEQFAFGITYNNSHAQSHNMPFSTSGNSNSITMFGQYVADNGMFINMGLNAGSTRWQSDKVVANIYNQDAYNTDFYAGQINTGVYIGRNGFAFIPHVGAQYIYTDTDKHTDDAIQTFDSWWYNTLTATAGVKMNYAFSGGGAIIIPHINIGGAYDAISHGTNAVKASLPGGQYYLIPIDAPSQAQFMGSLGLDIHFNNMTFGVGYQLMARADYTSHTATIDLKYVF